MRALTVHPCTPGRWPDLEALFGPTGAYAGCWCMYLRLTRAEFEAGSVRGGTHPGGNRVAMAAIVASGAEPGLLAYAQERPVGWVAVAPRDDSPRVRRSPVHKPVDDAAGVWAVTCFFVAPGARGGGVARTLLDAAVAHACARGAEIIEGYPIDPHGDRPPAAEMWRGSVALFAAAGFEIVARRRPDRPIMRLAAR
jgi:GNAT superfamily N-acetyltransferase